jgi:hypothetical protein
VSLAAQVLRRISGRKPRQRADTNPHMSATDLETGNAVAWRREQLVASGFDRGLATRLAREPRIDLHALIELVERGCPPPLAARILAPL